MSVDAFSGLPFQAGHAVAAGIGRTAKWVIALYMRAPLRNTAIAALTTLSAMAGSNALYNQTGHHPAPLFGSFDKAAVTSEPTPVTPMERPIKLLAAPAPSVETTGSLNATQAIPDKPVGNEDVFEIQRKLTAFKLFDAKVDGLYGPRTARAIKAFEEAVGRTPRGELTPEIVALIKDTPITAELGQQTEAAAAMEPAPVQSVTAEIRTETETPALTLVEETNALPAPAPLVAVEDAAPAAKTTAAELPPLEPTVKAEGVTTLEMTSPPAEELPAVAEQPVALEAAPPQDAATGPTKREVQTIAVRASAPEAPPANDVITAVIDVTKVASDPKIVGAIQRGLASLGFLHGEIDGVAGEATAKAIRNFEVYYNYNVTGRITPELVNLLVQNGAVI
jgi:peptidoglycan hydrolase-like protein with peptidoglycan-binding domain